MDLYCLVLLESFTFLPLTHVLRGLQSGTMSLCLSSPPYSPCKALEGRL